MRSKRIVLHDEEKLKNINPETAQIMQRYKIDKYEKIVRGEI